ncbi:MAG: molybdate ABC transporter substrate-binding protein [Deltaproteobacteria bacterium]|nr:molybdate ABC transporter substrate-binding protein [Deltaproteobacteria bacterium]
MIFLFTPNQAAANQKIKVAVAAGFIQPFEQIASEFKQNTGIKVEVTFTSAGRLYGQIINGAPYDIFLSADKERPNLLYDKMLCGKPFTYAIGEVVLWSAKKAFCISGNWRDALKQEGAKKIAIANPKTGVYGASAQKALKDAGLWNNVEPRLVTTEDLALVFQYATLYAVDAGFCALAHTYTEKGRKGCYYEMKEAPVVVHSACVLKRAQNKEITDRFAAFLVSPEAEKIKKKYGYKETSCSR